MQKLTMREMHEWKRRTVRYGRHRKPREADSLSKQKAIACSILALMVAAMIINCAMAARYPDPQQLMQRPQQQQPAPYPWATLTMAASTHGGPGLRYQITGMVQAGMAVQVLRHKDGWCCAWAAGYAEPVWICDDYLIF